MKEGGRKRKFLEEIFFGQPCLVRAPLLPAARGGRAGVGGGEGISFLSWGNHERLRGFCLLLEAVGRVGSGGWEGYCNAEGGLGAGSGPPGGGRARAHPCPARASRTPACCA